MGACPDLLGAGVGLVDGVFSALLAINHRAATGLAALATSGIGRLDLILLGPRAQRDLPTTATPTAGSGIGALLLVLLASSHVNLPGLCTLVNDCAGRA